MNRYALHRLWIYNDGKSWRARPHRELDATNEKFLMDTKAKERPEGAWPVYKGKSFGLWESDRGIEKYYLWAHPEIVIKYLQEKRQRALKKEGSPFSEFSKEWSECS